MSGEVNFVRQQGFRGASADSCGYRFPALMLQPRIIAALVLLGVLLQSWAYFLAVALVLWWNVTVPRLNPFDALYNLTMAKRRGLPPLGPAPGPRRFAQGMAGTFMLAIAACLFVGARGVAWCLEALLLVALGALVFGRFCLGSYVFHLVTGQVGFANRTLPWSRAE
jgi:hypothetical protein